MKNNKYSLNKETHDVWRKTRNPFRKLYYDTLSTSHLLSKHLDKMNSILDVGCGRNSSIAHIKAYKVGVDFYEPYIEESRTKGLHDEYINSDILHMPCKNKSFDAVVCTGVIEHIPKNKGNILITKLEKIARNKVIITTPNGFVDVKGGEFDNPEEHHLCGYAAKEFRQLGFKTYGINGFKFLRTVNKTGQAVLRSESGLYKAVVGLSEMVAYYFPDLAFEIFAVKNVG